MPSHSNFATPIQKNLLHYNFDITFINSSPEHLRRIKIPFKTSAYIFLRNLFFGDSSLKDKVRSELKDQLIYKEIQEKMGNQRFDHTLVIRPDLFSLEHLKLLKSKTDRKFIGYQWNGLSRFPNTFPCIDQFDRFFVFDQMDISNPDYKKYNLLGTTNFYFDMFQPHPIAHQGITAYFVGLHFDERSLSVDLCAQKLIKLGVSLDFNIRCLRDKQNAQARYTNKNIKFIERNIDFDENINRINQSDILVDVVNPVHNGLSFRTFEALYYKKKLITNNTTIKNYDFYHPNNIFVWNGQDLAGLKEFLATPFVSLSKKILEKYSFSNWINNLLDHSSYQQIELPESYHKIIEK